MENPRANRGRDDLWFNYMNLNLFCNRFGVGLCDYARNHEKSADFERLCRTMNNLIDKYDNWSPNPKYGNLVDNLLQSEEEFQLFAQSFVNSSYGQNRKRTNGSELLKKLRADLNKVQESKKMTRHVRNSIDRLVGFVTALSNNSVVWQEHDNIPPSPEPDRAVSVLLK